MNHFQRYSFFSLGLISGALQSYVLVMGVYSSPVDICTTWRDRSRPKETEENGKENEKSWNDVSYGETWWPDKQYFKRNTPHWFQAQIISFYLRASYFHFCKLLQCWSGSFDWTRTYHVTCPTISPGNSPQWRPWTCALTFGGKFCGCVASTEMMLMDFCKVELSCLFSVVRYKKTPIHWISRQH